MSWKCYSCGTENDNKNTECLNCGNTVAAPKNFYYAWIIGSALFFMVFFMAGTMAGGVLVESVATPSQATVLKVANEQRSPNTEKFKTLLQLEPKQLTAAKAVAIAQSKAKMSPLLVGIIQWTLPLLLFILGGLIVGFISDGFTVIEPGIGSIIGMFAAGALMITVFKSESVGWITLGIVALPGALFAVLGAWIGEKIQDNSDKEG